MARVAGNITRDEQRKLPPAVAGISLTALYAPNGFFGQRAAEIGWKIASPHWGIFIAPFFLGLPFVTPTVHPVTKDNERGCEEASATLGVSRLHRIRGVILPMLTPFARAVGE